MIHKTITVQLTEQDLATLVGLIDAGVRATGLRSCAQAAQIADKLQAAADAASKPVANGVSREMVETA